MLFSATKIQAACGLKLVFVSNNIDIILQQGHVQLLRAITHLMFSH